MALTILVAAGGTGGHLFPAEALAIALKERGASVALATDHRVAHYSGDAFSENVHIVPSATLRGGGPLAYVRTAATLAWGTLAARASVASATAMLRFASAAASASAGNRCPPVPPAATSTLAGVESVLDVMGCS